jgi:hypothetical protein
MPLFNRRVRKGIGGVLVALSFTALANIAWVRLDYASRMPVVPDSSSGRVRAIYANHARVYVTPEEARKLHHADNVATLFGLLGLVGMYIAVGRRRVE